MEWEFEHSSSAAGPFEPVAVTILGGSFHTAVNELHQGNGDWLRPGFYRGRPTGQQTWKPAELKADGFHSDNWDDAEEWGE